MELAIKINLALVIHNHQPVDNNDKVIETVYSRSYSPFLKCLSKFPLIKANLHYSGYLLEWLQKHHPEFIKLLQKMVKRGQIEIIGGGYYEPILTTIPEKDAFGQIDLLRQKIEDLFGVKPRGLWIAERAWEPSSPELLARSGIKYTILDDTIFRLSGVPEQECFFPYLVESRGSSVIIFPLLKKLRYLIPFEDVSKTISYLKKSRHQDNAEEEAIAVYGDDGEKFGAWPTTYDEVYTRGWLQTFFEHLVLNQDWLKTISLSDQLSRTNVRRRIHLPSASYPELMEWSLPVNSERRAVSERNGATGFWRLFLSKYPESGQLYARMLSISKMIDHFHGSSDIRRQALMELWKSQYNDVYWHGIFGGLYFPKFRLIAYHHLIMAQSLIESWLHKKSKHEQRWISIENSKNSGDFEDSIVVDTNSLGLTIKPSFGGCLTEIDFKPAGLNLTDVLARRFESYHSKIIEFQRNKVREKQRKQSRGATSIHELLQAKERGLRGLLVYDRYPKASFLDYVLKEDTTIDYFESQKFAELAQFAGYPYHCKVYRNSSDKETRRDAIFLILSRTSALKDSKTTLINVKKMITMNSRESKFAVNYDLNFARQKSKSQMLRGARFATEISLGSLGDTAFEKSFGKPSKLSKIKTVKFRYPKLGVSVVLDFSQKTSVWLVPIKSVSKSESGFESNLQGISVIPNFNLNDSTKFEVFFSVKKS